MTDAYWEEQFKYLYKTRTRWIRIARRHLARWRASERRALAAETDAARLRQELAEAREEAATTKRELDFVRGQLEEELGRHIVDQPELVLEAPLAFQQRNPGCWQ